MSLLDPIIREVQAAVGVSPDGVAGLVTWTEIHRKIIGNPPAPQSEVAILGLDPRSAKTLESLHLRARAAATAFLSEIRGKGLDVRAISGTRSYDEQNELYAKGRTAPGQIVTKARGGFSNHNFGIAFDVGVFQGGKYIEESPIYKQIAPTAKKHGLEWGGDWQSIVDEPHYEFHPDWAKGMGSGAMLAELRKRHDAGRDAFA